MNILYVSHLSTNIAGGLNWSVPASIKSQEKIDNCLWVDLHNIEMPHWRQTKCFHQLQEFGKTISLSILPTPFNHPDVVVFEGFYDIKAPFFACELRKNSIPYIVIPRGSLTKQALNNHAKWKKKIAHFLFFDKYVHKACAIQYLTEKEKNDSGSNWNKRSFIVPNGTSIPQNNKKTFHKDRIRAVFIGRLNMYHKGIDVFLEACNLLKEELIAANFSICFYGPVKFPQDLSQRVIIEKNLSSFVSLGGEISGVQKEKVLMESDLFVLTSRFEGHPMGLIEALAYGIPAIVTPGTNMAHEIREADAGWACNDVTVDEITKMLRQVISEKNRLMEKSINALKLAEPYDWDKLASKFHDELVKLLKLIK